MKHSEYDFCTSWPFLFLWPSQNTNQNLNQNLSQNLNQNLNQNQKVMEKYQASGHLNHLEQKEHDQNLDSFLFKRDYVEALPIRI